MPVIPQLFEHFKSRDEVGDILFQFSHFCGRFLSYAVNELVHGTVSLMGGGVTTKRGDKKMSWMVIGKLQTVHFFSKGRVFFIGSIGYFHSPDRGSFLVFYVV